ncbi:C40 family peptidase [Miltoncostaea oceani]|uniref:C40 family peptidase n=1 Tax=Miltoncostaea oceani TaxID=2843216 RepID=UPI001C3C75B7|nr:C40 family peptidase [Miltoncostaea oceani]
MSLPRLDDVRTDDRDRLAVEYVVGLELLGTKAGSFMPARGLSLAQARLAVVRGLGLESERAAIQGLSGLRMPAFAGSEVLARELGLVGNHLAEADYRERHAADQLSWAELFTLMDRLREVSSWDLERLGVFHQIALPELSPRERAVIQAGISQIGHPYVWGGSAPGRAGTTRRGAGFDCSGLVWWAYASAGQGESIHRWRSTAAAFAMTRGARHVPVAAAGPGDLVFYGAKGAKTRRSQIEHVGIALGGGWLLHSSGGRGGPTISYLPHYWSEGEVSARLIG